MTQITWTKCRERMPPDKPGNLIMFKTQSGILGQCSSRWFISVVARQVDTAKLEWTHYTPEAWGELNKYERD